MRHLKVADILKRYFDVSWPFECEGRFNFRCGGCYINIPQGYIMRFVYIPHLLSFDNKLSAILRLI